MSHPSWVCGLKHQTDEARPAKDESHPSWVCGLKRISHRLLCYAQKVTPFVGVWIETTLCVKLTSQRSVTPFVGVWNETENRFYFLSPLEKVIFTKTCH